MSDTSPIIARMNEQPVMFAPEHTAWFEACLDQANASLGDIEKRHAEDEMSASSDFWPDPQSWRARYRPYVVQNGVLQIPVRGVLVSGSGWQDGQYSTGYQYIWEAFKRGMSDGNVRGIALMIDSPGGAVNGNFELVDRMYDRRGEKPIVAFAADHAYSAAYSIATAADRIFVTRSGGVGSIGVVAMHVDRTKMMESVGYKVTLVYAGKHKIDFHSLNPLSEDARARLQAAVDATYDEFVSTVARNRGLSEAAVRGTEALMFTAQEALSKGLADEVGSLDDAVAAFAAQVSTNEGDVNMSVNKDESAVEQAAAIETARKEGRAEGHAAGLSEGATAERERISAILACEEAKTRPVAAMTCAMKTAMDLDAAQAFLGALTEEAAVDSDAATEPSADQSGAGAPKGMFEHQMDTTQNPDLAAAEPVSPDAAESGAQDVALARSLGITGFKTSTKTQQ